MQAIKITNKKAYNLRECPTHFKTHLQVKEQSFFFAVQEGPLNSSPEITQICSIYSKKDNNEMFPSSH